MKDFIGKLFIGTGITPGRIFIVTKKRQEDTYFVVYLDTFEEVWWGLLPDSENFRQLT